MRNKWFEKTFLPSLIEKMMNNTKYPGSIILTDKQRDICEMYMIHEESFRIPYLSYTLDMGDKAYSLMSTKRGKYYFLRCSKTQTQKHRNKQKEIMKQIDSLEDQLDIFYDNDDEENIKKYEMEIDDLWNEYNKYNL